MSEDRIASREPSAAISDATKLQAPIYVILRETGEYDEFYRQVIRYAVTEAEAAAAVELATEEGKTRAHERPVWPHGEQFETHGWQLADGSFVRGGPWEERHLAKWTRKPDADAIAARHDAAKAEHNAACLAMGCVDPDGPSATATYCYEVATRFSLVASVNEGD